MTRGREEDEEAEEGGWKSFFGKFNCGFKGVFEKAGEAASTMKEKISETNLG